MSSVMMKLNNIISASAPTSAAPLKRLSAEVKFAVHLILNGYLIHEPHG